MHNYLDFEKPISDLEGKIHELKKLASEDESIDTSDEVGRLEVRVRDAMVDIYSVASRVRQETFITYEPLLLLAAVYMAITGVIVFLFRKLEARIPTRIG